MAKSKRMVRYFRPVTILLVLTLLLMGAGVGLTAAQPTLSTLAASPPEPTYGTATVDGDYGESQTSAVANRAIALTISCAPSPPRLDVAKEVVPGSLQVGEQATVTLTVSGAGDPTQERQPLDVMLIIDRSGSMDDKKLTDAKAAAKAFIDLLNSSKDRVGLVSFADTARKDIGLTSDFAAVKAAINGLSAGGYTNIGDGIKLANQEFTAHGRTEAVWAEVLLSDGNANRPSPSGTAVQHAKNKAGEAASLGIVIYTIGLGSDVNAGLMEYIADTTGGSYYFAPDSSDLQAIFEEVAYALLTLAGSNVTVTEVLPVGVSYVDGSASPPPDSVLYDTPSAGKTTLIWNLGTMSIGDEEVLTLNITAGCCGQQLADDPATRVEYIDYQGQNQTTYFPETWVEVACPPVASRVELLPETGSNQVGTNHDLTATVYDQFNNEMPDQALTWEITSGPGDFVGIPDGTTDAFGEAHASISSTVVGTTTVKVSVSAEINDTATKDWTAGDADRVELLPESDTNQVGTEHDLTATVYDQYNNVMPDQALTWEITSGPGDFVGTPEGTTDASGEAHATISSNIVGTTTVKVSVSQDIYDTATKDWTAGDAVRVELLPESDTNQVGTQHDLTATVYDQYNNVVPDQALTWEITSGPGDFVGTPEGTTDANGEAHATITSTVVGTTTVKVSVSQDIYDTATKDWTAGDAARVELLPESDTNQIGTQHALTATVYDQYDNVVPDQALTWEITSGPGDFVGTPEGTTDANGEAHATISSNIVGTTTVKVSVSAEIYDEATKEWTLGGAARIELLPETGTNEVGTEHALTATVYDQYDNVVADQALTWEITSGPGDFVGIPDGTTDAFGEAHASISSTVVGTTTVKVSVSAEIEDTATKVWTVGEAARIELLPETGTNQVGTQHALTATVYDQYDNAVAEQEVEWAITDGPGDFVGTPDGITDANGEAHASIISSVVGITTVKVSMFEEIYDTATKVWMSGGGGGGGGTQGTPVPPAGTPTPTPTPPAAPAPELTLTKSADVTSADVGDTITYTFTVKNTGDTTISGLVLSDPMLGVISLDALTLAPGETASSIGGPYTYVVDDDDLPGPLVNTATVSGTDSEGNPVSDEDSASVKLSETAGGGIPWWVWLIIGLFGAGLIGSLAYWNHRRGPKTP